MSLLCGTAASCAANRTAFRRPLRVAYTFLQQPQEAAYFRAFDNISLSLAELGKLAVQHLQRAAANAGWPSENLHRIPVFVGSSSYAMSDYENRYRDGTQPTGGHSLLALADCLKQAGWQGRIHSFATACTSAAHALIHADRFLNNGGTHALVLGIESFNLLTLLHFHSLGLLSDTCLPFGGNGLIPGEGIAALALSSETAQAKGRLKLIGHAANTGNDLIQSDSGAQEAVIRAALAAARLAPRDITTVKTHGVGTSDSDCAEMHALQNVFGTPPPLLAFKPETGHTLGASGAIETALLAERLQQGYAEDYQGRRIVFSDGTDTPCRILGNHFGFGGSNTALVWQWTP